ncbi:hypothetical protein HGRIS_001753 [Hohenbuehelia grisea]|uniref:Uncharacterized protein n=1 Tax=Hohenbuehelia grisea TaxID=104357 RepID=A0ABR3JJ73_9AGAR
MPKEVQQEHRPWSEPVDKPQLCGGHSLSVHCDPWVQQKCIAFVEACLAMNMPGSTDWCTMCQEASPPTSPDVACLYRRRVYQNTRTLSQPSQQDMVQLDSVNAEQTFHTSGSSFVEDDRAQGFFLPFEADSLAANIDAAFMETCTSPADGTDPQGVSEGRWPYMPRFKPLWARVMEGERVPIDVLDKMFPVKNSIFVAAGYETPCLCLAALGPSIIFMNEVSARLQKYVDEQERQMQVYSTQACSPMSGKSGEGAVSHASARTPELGHTRSVSSWSSVFSEVPDLAHPKPIAPGLKVAPALLEKQAAIEEADGVLDYVEQGVC